MEEDDPRGTIYKRFKYEIDDENKTMWIARETGGPAQEPVRDINPADAEIVEITVASRQAKKPSPSSYFNSVNPSSESGKIPVITGPLQTMTSTYYLSTTLEPLKSPPPRSARYPFVVATIWVNDVIAEDPVRQAFVWNEHEEWVVVPGEAVEQGKVEFPHPTDADKWFSMSSNGAPGWLKAATIQKQKRQREKDMALGFAGSVGGRKRTRIASDPVVKGKVKRAATPMSPTPRSLRSTPKTRKTVKIVTPEEEEETQT